jgi:hypothetical protein
MPKKPKYHIEISCFPLGASEPVVYTLRSMRISGPQTFRSLEAAEEKVAALRAKDERNSYRRDNRPLPAYRIYENAS